MKLVRGECPNMAHGMQDDTLAAQAALEKQVSAVGEDVEDIQSRVGEVSRHRHRMCCGRQLVIQK